MIRQEIRTQIAKIAAEMFAVSGDIYFNVEEPPTGADADLASNAAFILSKTLKKAPKEIAEQLAEKIKSRIRMSRDFHTGRF